MKKDIKKLKLKVEELTKMVLEIRPANIECEKNNISLYDINRKISRIEFNLETERIDKHLKEMKEEKNKIDKEIKECEFAKKNIEDRYYQSY